MIRLVVVASVISAACSPGPREFEPKGPLGAWLPYEIRSLQGCTLDTTTIYGKPFWRAPYWRCRRDMDKGFDRVDLDADSVVVSIYSSWETEGPSRATAFDTSLNAMSRKLGRPQHRLRTCAAWVATDTLQAELRMRATSDVAPTLYERPWIVTRHVRLGRVDAQCG